VHYLVYKNVGELEKYSRFSRVILALCCRLDLAPSGATTFFFAVEDLALNLYTLKFYLLHP
jgi:hypothetical protein